ncbi:amidohydrolase family protein [Propionivibrio limicola]|uniref:amidohydrolase family protein n=1 Tax=Propionivibrio limicola TaxID=167645 RepID=UPI001291B89C|nr:amidohydrolase family protein [Propionivibrio limicola]
MSIFNEPKIDCHNHVFDPDRFPYEEDNFYYPAGQEKGTPAQFMRVLDAYGVGHALMVEPNSGYGPDNRCMLDTIARSNGRVKGVAVVANAASRSELEDLKAQGIVGIAFNPALFGVKYYADAAGLLERMAELDLIAQIQVVDNQLVDMLPMLKASRVRLLFDHCGRPNPAAGLDQPGFKALLELGRSGNAGVKLSGYAKFSHLPHPYEDTWSYVRALVDAFTLDACVWGTDWPFLRAPERIDYGVLLKLVERLFPDANDRRKLLWETPCRWFGFDPETDKGAC